MRSLLRSCAARGSAALRIAHATSRFSSSIKATSSSNHSHRWSPRPRASRLSPIGAASTSTSSSSSPSSSPAPSSSSSGREHPAFPRVGVATVLFMPPRRTTGGKEIEEPSVLLIRRAKPPNAGLLSFAGGALELGEGIVAGAERELSEEVPGLEFERDASVAGELAGGVAFAAADSIHYDDDEEDFDDSDDDKSKGGAGKKRKKASSPRFHWAIIEVAAVAKASSSSSPGSSSPTPQLSLDRPPQTADDACGSRWVGALSELPRLEERGEVTAGCARVAAEAVRRFGKDLGYYRKLPV